MESLFFKLFRAGSSERDRLEDFLTEIVADLLGRLPPCKQLTVCKEVLLPNQDTVEKRDWIKRAEKCTQFTWRTQVPVNVPGAVHAKRPDIVFYGDNDPLMVAECKIGANFTAGSLATDGDGDGGTTTLGQLRFYDIWLHDKSGPIAALVLLTHLVDPPEGFLDRQGTYTTALRSVCRWAQFYNWLTNHGGANLWNDHDRILVENLISFLKEKDLMCESPTLSDFAAARLYLCGGAHERAARAMSAARQAVIARFPNLNLGGFPNNSPKLYSSPGSGWLCDWCHSGDGPFIDWGIFFVRENSDVWNGYHPPVLVFEGAYMSVGFQVQPPEAGGFEHWHFPTAANGEGTFAVTNVVPLNDLQGDFSAELSEWVTVHFGEAVRLIAAVAGN